MTEPLTIESAADLLYAIPPEEFVARRTVLAKETKAAGDKDLGARIGRLGKPTRSAWMINILARDAADELHELLELGAALAEATRALSGPDLRALSTQRNAAVDALVRRAVALAANHDHAASEAQRTEVAQTLQAALADPNVARVVRSGVLTRATQYGGFGPLDVIGAVDPGHLPTPTAQRTATGADDSRDSAGEEGDTDEATAREAARTAAQARLAEATAAASRAIAAAEEADREVDRAAEQADELIMQVAQLRSRLNAAEAEAETARTTLAEATERRDRTRAAADEADRAVVTAESALRDLT